MFSSLSVLLLLVINPIQVVSRAETVWHNFTPYTTFTVDQVMAMITKSNVIGSPIQFIGSDTTVDYTDYSWSDPCYQKGLDNNASFVLFWHISDTAYCTIHVTNRTAKSTAPFSKSYLARIELAQIRCE